MINERIKQLRKELKLSGEKFGEKLGVKRSAISDIETGRNNLTDQMFLSICREFNVNENWLRTGEGEMFLKPLEFSLDEFCKSRNMSELELEILKAYFNIPEDIRKQALNHFVAGLQSSEISDSKDNTIELSEKERFLKIAEEQFDKEKERESQASSVKESDAG